MATGRVPTTANSPLTTKGDLFGYSTSPARLAVGADGEQIVADSSTSTGLRYQGNFAAGKNKIINGDFGVWQRGTSFSTFGYTADRWAYGWGGGSGITGTITQQTFTPGTAPVSGYEGTFFLRHNITNTGGATSVEIESKLEDVRLFAGQTVTLSAWLKADAARTFRFDIVQDFGSGGSSAVVTAGSSQTLTTGWVRYTQTISVPSISSKTIGTSSNLRFRLRIDPANYTVDIWGAQLEAGSVATAFQTATGTIQGELAACQRYYFRAGGDEAYQVLGTGITEGSNVICEIRNPTTLRVKPSSVDFSTLMVYDGSNILSASSVALGLSSRWVSRATITPASAPTAFRPYWLFTNNSTSGFIGFSAEL